MYTVGLDVGSMMTKGVLLNRGVWQSVVIPTGYSPRQAGEQAFEKLLRKAGLSRKNVDVVIGTGYGRVALSFIDRAVTEITCHAKGAHYLVEGTDMVIDIGGQDSKVILTDGRGNVTNFVMNDKCAAGTGRFLQVMAAALGCDVSELADLADNSPPAQISSMCTVFAESEVIGLLVQGVSKARIIAGIHRSVATRVAAMAARLGCGQQITFTGGVAKNAGIKQCLIAELNQPITTVPESHLAGALGAALIAQGN
ncbi:MAG: 2-hydroxyglutaryl-CoA dehydratase [Peptococcaceae bacterium]|nr:2-hydroxyglutaryl-CoA dehydratase [Peptococcaceae bacterium]